MNFPLFDLSGRRALVTGSSQGIGYALALGLAEHGASVIINGLNAQKAEAAAETIRERKGHAVSAAFDVTDANACRSAIAYIEAEIGPIDILINNAGM